MIWLVGLKDLRVVQAAVLYGIADHSCAALAVYPIPARMVGSLVHQHVELIWEDAEELQRG